MLICARGRFFLESRRRKRQLDARPEAAAVALQQIYRSAVQARDAIHDRESETGARTAARGVEAGERLQHALGFALGYSRSAIQDFHEYPSRELPGHHFHPG